MTAGRFFRGVPLGSEDFPRGPHARPRFLRSYVVLGLMPRFPSIGALRLCDLAGGLFCARHSV